MRDEQVGFESALVALKVGRSVRRASWPASAASISLIGGILICGTGNVHAHSLPAGDLLATDWIIL